MSTVRLSSVCKSFGSVEVVKNINLLIKEGAFCTLLGPSGCGKTTLLRMIAGFYYPTSGEIYIDDREVTNVPPNKREIGMVFQNYALFPHMTVGENVAFGLESRGMKMAEALPRVKKYLEMVRLGGYEKRKVTELSGGQQQRVALARALVIEPRILLLDEPLSNLDAKLREEMRGEIKGLQEQLGITTIYVTHDQAEALTMSDTIVVIEQGICQQIGSPDEIYSRPANAKVAKFVGETNLIPCSLVSATDSQATACTESGGQLSACVDVCLEPDKQVYAMIRPEAAWFGDSRQAFDEVNRLSGVIKQINYNGSTVHYLAAVGNDVFRIMCINGSASQSVKPGDTVDIFFRRSDARLIQ